MGDIDPVAGLLNTGMATRNWDTSDASQADVTGKTIIVSGIARGGTSMVAKVLRTAGLFMGERCDDVVHEDVDMSRCLESAGRAPLRALIEARNDTHASWGFKRPNLHELIRPVELSLFRNPRLILIFRDPIAVAQRNIVSMHSYLAIELDCAIKALVALTSFALEAECPVLLISYEKALMKRDVFLDQVLRFCGIPQSPGDTLQTAIAPENPRYREVTQLRLEGAIEGIEARKLIGWCRIPENCEAVSLELLVSEMPARAFEANLVRPDHDTPDDQRCRGFACDLTGLELTASSIIGVRMMHRSLRLSGSGQTVGQLSSGEWIDSAPAKPATRTPWARPLSSIARFLGAYAPPPKRSGGRRFRPRIDSRPR